MPSVPWGRTTAASPEALHRSLHVASTLTARSATNDIHSRHGRVCILFPTFSSSLHTPARLPSNTGTSVGWNTRFLSSSLGKTSTLRARSRRHGHEEAKRNAQEAQASVGAINTIVHKSWFENERNTRMHLQNLETARRLEHQKLLAAIRQEGIKKRDPMGPHGDGTLPDVLHYDGFLADGQDQRNRFELIPAPVAPVGPGLVDDSSLIPSHDFIQGSSSITDFEFRSPRLRSRRGAAEAMRRQALGDGFGIAEFAVRNQIMQMDRARSESQKALMERIKQESLRSQAAAGADTTAVKAPQGAPVKPVYLDACIKKESEIKKRTSEEMLEKCVFSL